MGLNYIPSCKSLPPLKHSKSRCIKLISLVMIEEGAICKISASCDGFLNSNYTCDSDKSECKHNRIYTNHDSYGSTRNASKMSFITSLIKTINKSPSESKDLIINNQLDDVKVCSIENLWTKKGGCNSTFTHFGEVHFTFYDNGTMIITPLATTGDHLLFDDKDVDFYDCNDYGCLEQKPSIVCTGDKHYCSKINRNCNPGSLKSCRMMINMIGFKSKDKSSKVLMRFTSWLSLQIEMIDEANDDEIEIWRDLSFPKKLQLLNNLHIWKSIS